ncbi:hypothetical protein [Sporomusa termitida]|uniref:Uncharacterized protein n=1 Tax=Sporomusa termitida TaxID=2377 RepID=A0A517DZB9_9FIRM|nr:hypothetical protein [Sporomusa termitida]QDR82596.1 hypothetical protein SPTER_40240 [Sporomusa termitida]
MNFVSKLVLVILLTGILGSSATAVALTITPGLNLDRLPEWEVTASSRGGTLLLSDSPEMVRGNGILYQDTVSGFVRLFFYHVNASRDVKKIAVLLKNQGEHTAQVIVRQATLGGPGNPWLKVGKETQSAYFGEKQAYRFSIPPAGVMPLAASLEETAIVPNMLVNGIYDFEVDQPVTVTVMMLPVTESSIPYARTATVLAADECHLRGTFAGANRQITPVRDYDPAAGEITGITLADNEIDPYVTGIDATDGSAVLNYGNYGIVYEILLPAKPGGKVSYYLAPLGGSYAGAVGINHPEVNWSPVSTPRDRLYFGDNYKQDWEFLGTYDSGDPLSFTFSPPGASNLPVKIVIVPHY